MTGSSGTGTRNVLQVAVAFLCVFFAFNTQSFVEQPVLHAAAERGVVDPQAGYYSLSIIYLCFTVSSFFAAPIIEKLGERRAMFLASLAYAAFEAGFLFTNSVYLYLSSAIIGTSASVLWSAQGRYLTRNCTPSTTKRNSALLWTLQNSSTLLGGLVLYIMLSRNSRSESNASEAANAVQFSESLVLWLYAIFTAMSLVGSLILLLLRAPINRVDESEAGASDGWLRQMGSTFRLAKQTDMLVLAVVFSYTGVGLAFWGSIFPTAVSFSTRLSHKTHGLIALVVIATGCGQTSGGALWGALGGRANLKISRTLGVLTGCLVHLIGFAVVAASFPAISSLEKTAETGPLMDAQVWLVLVIAFLLGFGDACWSTQIYAVLVAGFSSTASEAFALYRFYQSLLASAAFFYGAYVQLHFHLALQSILAIAGLVCFVVVDRRLRHRAAPSMTTITGKSSSGLRLADERDATA